MNRDQLVTRLNQRHRSVLDELSAEPRDEVLTSASCGIIRALKFRVPEQRKTILIMIANVQCINYRCNDRVDLMPDFFLCQSITWVS